MRVYSRILFFRKIILVVGFFVLIGFFVMTAMASDRFLNNRDGTVTDTKTGLMWAAMDNGIPINWQNSLLYCQNYSGGSHTDWRMPTLGELESLYDPGAKNKRGYHVTKLIDLKIAFVFFIISSILPHFYRKLSNMICSVDKMIFKGDPHEVE